jgi:hypothetical protein
VLFGVHRYLLLKDVPNHASETGRLHSEVRQIWRHPTPVSLPVRFARAGRAGHHP